MKIRTLALATAIAVTATGYAFAQGTGTPTERAGSKSPDTSSSGTSNDTMAKDKMMNSGTTTGAAPTTPNKLESPNAKSPANTEKDNKNKGN